MATTGARRRSERADLPDERRAHLDAIVARARQASLRFRELDQARTDAIVWAMVVAGLEHAADLAQLAIEETGFGVFEDKVVKNYVATEFLYDYLKDKRTVGVIDEDAERAIQYVAEPIGVVLAVLPITNPTSTVLFKAIVAAKTRNAVIFRPSSRAERCCVEAARLMNAAALEAGAPEGALQVLEGPTRVDTQYLFHHPDVDFIWTTGGQQIVTAANASGKPTIGVGPGNAPVYLHASCDLKMAVVDVLISKTFDASLICPAEQTAVIDDSIYDAALTEFERMGAAS
jgi:acetaldehyde dehydrogenase/alcohol dehydrogenase